MSDNNFIPADPIFTKEQTQQLIQSLKTPGYQNSAAIQTQNQIQGNIAVENINTIESTEERLQFITKRLDQAQNELIAQTKALQKIQYENMKLNAQIEVLNKTIDSDNEKLDELNAINAELRAANKSLENNNRTLKNNNKHYWRNTALISIGSAVLGVILGVLL